jgi:hypothetical protein
MTCPVFVSSQRLIGPEYTLNAPLFWNRVSMNTSVDNEKLSSADDHLAGRETMCETGGLSINATENGPNSTLIRVNSGLENGSQAVGLQRFRIKTPRISNDPASSAGWKNPNGWQVKSFLENDFRRIGPLSKTRVWLDAPDNWKKKRISRRSDGGYHMPDSCIGCPGVPRHLPMADAQERTVERSGRSRRARIEWHLVCRADEYTLNTLEPDIGAGKPLTADG